MLKLPLYGADAASDKPGNGYISNDSACGAALLLAAATPNTRLSFPRLRRPNT